MKIISLQPSVSIILDRLDCLDSLVACTKYCLEAVPALRARGLPIVHDSWSVSDQELVSTIEEVCFATNGSDRANRGPRHARSSRAGVGKQSPGRPVLVASVPYRMESLAAILKSGTPVLALAPHTLADIYCDIQHLARLLDIAPKGEALILEMQSAIESVRAQAPKNRQRPLVYCEEWGKPLIHSQRWVAELVEIAGGTFLGTPGATTTAEAVAAANPDVIVAAWCGAGNRVPLEKIIPQRNWQNLAAARNARVYCVADELLNTPAPTLIQGLHALASIIHPEIFGNPGSAGIPDIHQICARLA